MAWIQVNFFSNCLMRSVPLNVLLPAECPGSPGAPLSETRPFKTLYLLHGYHGSCNDWLLGADVQSLSLEFGLAIVMPSGCNDFYVDTPSGSSNMSSFISGELVDFTRRLFPLSHRREDTILGGLSMGGFGTLYNCFTHSEIFGHGISLSAPGFLERKHIDTISENPNFMGISRGFYQEVFGEDIASLPDSPMNPRVAAALLSKSGKPVPSLYIACGYNDILKYDNRRLCRAIDEIGIPYFYEEGPGSHEWSFWSPYLRRGLERIITDKPPEFVNPFWVDRKENEGGDA